MVQALASSPSDGVSLSQSFTASVSYQQGAGGQQRLDASVALVENLTTPSGSATDAFTIDLSAESKAPKALQDLQKAVDTLKQGAAEAAAFQKAAAAKQLEDAIKQLQLLKLLGDPAKGAKEAARLAKQIGNAATAYAGANPAGGSATGTLLASNQQASDARAAGAEQAVATAAGLATAPADPSAAPGSAAASSGDAAATTAAVAAVASSPADAAVLATLVSSPGDFFAAAEAALGEIQKYLSKVLVELRASPNKADRDEAKRAGDTFDKAVGDTLAAAQASGIAAAGPVNLYA
jgi:hypothetical protein